MKCSYSLLLQWRLSTWMRSCSAHNDCKGVLSSCRASLAERDHRVRVCAYTFWEAQMSRVRHRTRGRRRTKGWKKEHNDVTSLDEAAHHKAPECTEKSQRDRNTLWFVQNKISSMHKSFLDFYFPERTKWGFVWQQMTCTVSESDMLAWSSTILCKDGAPE